MLAVDETIAYLVNRTHKIGALDRLRVNAPPRVLDGMDEQAGDTLRSWLT
jgi:hypothetical protein